MTSTTTDLVRALREEADELDADGFAGDLATLLCEAAQCIEGLAGSVTTLNCLVDDKTAELAQLRAERHEHYTSTACMHAQHESCRRQCKFCGRDCLCSCHAALDADAQ